MLNIRMEGKYIKQSKLYLDGSISENGRVDVR